jgi:hypothetical protein
MRHVGICSLAVAVLSSALVISSPARAATVTITPIGTPAWDVVDTHVFSTTVGTEASGYQEFFDLAGKVLPEPNHKVYPNVGVGPGQPHNPPYDQEIAQGLSALGISDSAALSASDFSNGQGVNLAFMIVGNGDEVGSSPEFDAGAILPNSLFPLHFDIANKKGGADFSAAGAFDVPSHTTLDPAFADLEGTSHLPFFVFDNADFALDKSASLAGSYQLEVKVTDAAGNGYNVIAPYTVSGGGPSAIPLPAAVVPGAMMLAAALGVRPATRLLSCRKA